MSLVAYASSDEESEQDEEIVPTQIASKVDQISDDEDDFARVDFGLDALKKSTPFALLLPKPKTIAPTTELIEDVTPKFANLPMPKSTVATVIEEADDEFLHKKAVPIKIEETPPKGPVKITIPSLKDFDDVDKEKANKLKSKMRLTQKPKGSGLLSILPKAKSEQNFAKAPQSTLTTSSALIPDTVKNRRPAHNTEGVDGVKVIKKKPLTVASAKPLIPLVNGSDSEASDDDAEPSALKGDFFSLNKKVQLPEVSANEINAMVAKRAAKMIEATTNYLDSTAAKKSAEVEQVQHDEDMQQAQKRYHEQQLDAEAMQALVGSSSKRRRRHQPDIQVMDISSDQVLPDREEWMRTALASSTTYQPTGVLVDEEPASGTRRKHQITYLAHKAKANEAELQAMWAANRQNRRATQSKYGF